jgi:hypothetical protein
MRPWYEDEPAPFDRLVEEKIDSVLRWVLVVPAAPSRLSGETAIHADDRGAPDLVLDGAALRPWLTEELRALEKVAAGRVAANRDGTGPGETVAYQFECQSDDEAMMARILVLLMPRDDSIGKIVLSCELMKIEDGRFAIWASGLPHAAGK